ncbi:MAG: TIGR01212 family radical SAM protein [Epulopiscium sp. Nele67-Bin005]|nr:MAG: TIGR01212 family radical SAM protein [Epulopiscium sp. Nele67-Bin005]
MPYKRYATHLKNKYGDKVYKVPINLDVTCPNRDGNCSSGGCTFCGDIGVGYEMLDVAQNIKSQIDKNIEFMKKRYKAKYFIPYLQNYSNTYMPIEKFCNILEQLEHPDFVGISVSTRPDCIHPAYLEALEDYRQKTNYDICIELGLQTVNYHSLEKINRGHGLAEFIDAVLQIKQYNFEIGVHLILNLPWDNEVDVIENAKMMSALKVNYVKLHALYILKDTPMGKQFADGNLDLITEEEYKERVILFLRYLNEDIIIQRIIGRVPEEFSLFANWGSSWWKIHDDIIAKMQQENWVQGDSCNYLTGKAVRQKNFI